MSIRNENSKQHGIRFAQMLRNSQQRKAEGIRPGANRRNWMKLDTLLGVPFEIVEVDFEHESQQYGRQTRVDIELATGESASFTANATLDNQLRAMDAEEFQDVLYTIIQDGTFTGKGNREYVKYLLDYAEDETGKPNTPARNRARVASQKNIPQVTEYDFDEDDDEDDDEEDDFVPPSRSQTRQTPSKSNGRTSVPAPRKPAPAPSKNVAPVKSNKLPGKPIATGVQVTGNGKFPRGRGRPPMGAAVYNSSNGHYYDANGNKLR